MDSGFEELLQGFSQFCDDYYGNQKSLMPRLVEQGQNPEYMIISCIDSRSNPGTIFQTVPGIFFGHKAMGAIVRPYQQGTALAASLQFAICHSNITKIILLGHTGCGAVKALVENLDDPEISSFVSVAKSGLEKARLCCVGDHLPDDLLRRTEEQIILLSTENLKTYPSVRQAMDQGTLEIASWLFNMEEGALYHFVPEQQSFVKLAGLDLKKTGAIC